MISRTEGFVYLVGVVIFGLVYYPLKQSVSDLLFVVIVIGYLVILRIIGRLIAVRSSTDSSVGSDDA